MIKECYGHGDTVVLKYCCDFCQFSTTHNKTSTGITPIMECDGCDRHVCSGHRIIYESPLFSDRRVYCLECWDIGRKYRERMIQLQGEAWENEKNIRIEWHNEGREKKRRQNLQVAGKKREEAMSDS